MKNKDACEWFFYSSDILCPKNHEEVANPYWKMPEPEHMFRLKFCPYCGKKIFISNKEKYYGLKGKDNESPDC